MTQAEVGFAKTRQHAQESDVDAIVPIFAAMLQGLRQVFNSGRTRDLAWRERQMDAVLEMVEQRHEQITAAVRADLGGPKLRGLAECNPHASARVARENLRKWAQPETIYTPFEVSPTRLGKSTTQRVPKGVVLIIAPWNYPIELALHPLVAAVSAGNCVVLKPSEVSRASAQCIADLVNKYMDTDCIKVVQGSVAETQALLRLQWDHIFYTGSGDIGRKVMAAAAAHLTPVTLELGGKSPVIIDKSAKINVAVERVGMAKWFNAGQTCIAPDYVLVDNSVKDKFISGLKAKLVSYYGEDPEQSPDFGRIINERHARRILDLIKSDTSGKVVCGGAEKAKVGDKYVPPTIIDTQNFDASLLKEEIFGPVLPVVGVDSIAEAVDKVHQVCDRPLALYCFSENRSATDRVLGSTISGGCCVNTAMEHVMNHELPFGGVGSSGLGAYHGKAGFDEFTHRRGCLDQDTMLKQGASLPPPPYTDGIYDMIVKVMVVGLIPKKLRPLVRFVLRVSACALVFLAVRRFVF